MNAWRLWISLFGLELLVACSSDYVSPSVPTPRAQEVNAELPSPTVAPANPSAAVPTVTSAVSRVSPTLTATSLAKKNNRVKDPKQYFYTPLLPFDAIAPVYDPRFVPAAQAPLQDAELVLAIALAGNAKAYPITVLRFREMVDDELAGIPILVTW